MAASMDENIGDSSSRIFALTTDLEDFLSVNKSRSAVFAESLKSLYDTSKSFSLPSAASSASLQELIVTDFDDEQIWQQLELENDLCISTLISGSAKLIATKSQCSFKPGTSVSSKSPSKQYLKKPVNDVKDSDTLSKTKISKLSKGERTNLEEKKLKSKISDDFDDGDYEDDNEVIRESNDDDEDVMESNDDDDIADLGGKLEKIDKDDKFFDFTGDSDEDLNFDFGPLGQRGNLDEELFKDDDDNSNEKNKNGDKSKNKNKKSVTFNDEMTGDEVDKKYNKKKAKQNFKKGSVVDDDFFKLSELEDFLDQEDRREERRLQQGKTEDNAENDEEDENDDNIDMFGVTNSEDGDVHYEDFFDPPDGEIDRTAVRKVTRTASDVEEVNIGDDGGDDGGDDDDDDEDHEEDKSSGHAEKDEENGPNEHVADGRVGRGHDLLADSESEGEDVRDILGGKREKKSTYEIRQERLKKKISTMEENMMSEKPWQMAGEIAGGKRPENSLLQESLQFDHTTRLPPEITEETTMTLEGLIRQRIKDKAWDDVERKVKTKENPYEYKKRITLDQEKSKLSLGEIYEQEYLKQQKSEETEKTDPGHEDIKKMMQSLFLKLDALSNFHYTPKQATAEVKVITNQPSITMEEVAPISVSDGKLLAPEEIKDKAQDGQKGDTEKTQTDRLRERKLKKKGQRLRRREEEKRHQLIEKLNPGLGNKYSKEKALKQLEKDSKSGSKGVTMLKGDKKAKIGLTSSKTFFSQLQDEVTTSISRKRADRNKKPGNDSSAGKKLKL